MSDEDTALLLHCIHNALWMAAHKDQMRAVDEHIATLGILQQARAKEMLGELMRS